MTAAEAVCVITIDGPSGSGKGTVSRVIARQLGWHYLDSGALYRVLAHAARSKGLEFDNAEALARLAQSLDVEFREQGENIVIFLDGEDVSNEIRTERTGEAASIVAALVPVRSALLMRQRAFARPPGLVADGRDMGTVVFPSAMLKVFLTASPQERANRRHKQLKDKGISVSLPALANEIAERDARDANRGASPLRAAADARLLDSTGLTAAQVAEQILAWLKTERTRPDGS